MMPKNSGMHTLENVVRMREPSTPFVREAPSSIGGVGPAGGVGDMNTDAAHPPSEAVSKRAAAEPSPPHGGLSKEEPEYEVDDVDLIYERTGTLCFPYPSRIVESGVRAPEAAGARPRATGAPSVGSEPPARSSLGRLVRDLRAVSAGTPGVSMLATVDVAGGEPASTAKRREPSTPPSVAEAKGDGPSSTSITRALRAPRSMPPQKVAVGPAFVPPRRSSVVANRAPSTVAPTFVASPSSPASRHSGPSRGREARSFAPVPNARRTTKPSLLVKQRARRSYPSFGQRVLAEVRRIPLAKRSAALGVVVAVVVAGVFVASSTLVFRRVPQERVAARSSVAAVVDERAPVPAPAHVGPRVSVVVAEEAPPEPPKALERPAADAPLSDDRSKGAKATARSNLRVPTQPRPHGPCDCLPGDPLCGCLD